MRRSPFEEGQRWLAQAAADLHWAKYLAREGGYHLSCFLAQQIVEKAVKAFLYAQGEDIVLGHSVGRLCEAAARYQPEFAERGRHWGVLDGYYIPTRYPNGLPDGIPAEVYNERAALDAVALAEEAVNWISQLLSAGKE